MIIWENIKAIFFDMGGTLINLQNSHSKLLYDNLFRNGIYLGKEQVDECLRKLLFLTSSLDKNAYSSTYFMNAMKFAQMSNVAYNKIPDIAKAFVETKKQINQPDYWVLEKNVETILQKFSQNYLLGILSNWDNSFYEFVNSFGLTDYFDVYICSSEVGSEKPDPAIFYKALAKFEISPNEGLYIGNDYFTDILPTQKVGMHGILYDPHNLNQHNCKTITDFNQLL